VKFKSGISTAAMDATIVGAGGESVRDLPQIRTRVITVPESARATALVSYAKHAAVERAAAAVLLRAAGTQHDAKAEDLIKKDSEGVATAQQHPRHFTS